MVSAGDFRNGITIEMEGVYIRLLSFSMLNREKELPL